MSIPSTLIFAALIYEKEKKDYYASIMVTIFIFLPIWWSVYFTIEPRINHQDEKAITTNTP